MVFRRLALLLGAAALVALLPGSAGAQDTTRAVEVAPITVTAVRTLGAAPPVVTVTVTGERIRDAQATDPYDLVRRLTGIEVHQQGQGPGFASDAVLRGFTSDHSSDVLLVVDGVPINLPVHGHIEGYADWNLLIAPALSEMRVINGPASPRYGDFAFGGVVEAFNDLDASSTSGALTGSSYGDAGGWLRTGVRGSSGGGLAAFEGHRQNGWRDNSDYWLGNGLVRGWHALGHGQIDGGVSAYGSSWNSPGFVSVARYNAGDLTAATDPTDGGEAGRLIAQAHYTRVLGSQAGLESTVWAQGGRSTVFLNIPDADGVEQTEEREERLAAGARAQVVWPLAGGTATAGATGRADASTYDLYSTLARVRQAQRTGYDGDYRSGGFYLRWRTVLGARLALDLGGRLDALHYASLDRLSADPQRVSATDWLVSPKVGARLLLSPGLAVLGSFSRGFRGAPGVIGDPGRPPMTEWASEVGIQAAAGAVRARVAGFRLDVSHERIEDPLTLEISEAGASVRQGISADVDVQVWRALGLFTSVTFNDASVSQASSPALQGTSLTASQVAMGAPAAPSPLAPSFHVVPLEPGDPVPGVGRYVGRAGLTLAPIGHVSGQATLRFSGPFTPSGEPTVRTSPYTVLDLASSIRLWGGTAVDAELENVFDTRYPEVRASGYLNPGWPRTLRVALRFGTTPANTLLH
jgi:TonB dependent receptor-like, beta-barrel/TonB-dependent Receptor Plug Domain